jgi:hypothetical protein
MKRLVSRRKERAIALIVTMALLVVISMLLGAFMATRESLISMSRLSAEQQACRDTLRSLASFCRFRLEGRDTWGRVPGDPEDAVEYRDVKGNTVFKLTPIGTPGPDFDGLVGLTFFQGEAPQAGVTLQLAVSNNLDSETPNVAMGVAPKSCALRVRASRGTNLETVEVVLRKASFFDSTVAASGEIKIEADKVNFSSSDPLRNQIRSKSDIRLPDTQDIVFTPHSDVQTPEKGTIWAQGDIFIGGDASESKLRAAAVQTGGEFLPNAPTRYSVPELKKADLDCQEVKPIIDLAPVVYEFAEETVYYKDTEGTDRERKMPVLIICEPAENQSGSDHFVEFHFHQDALIQPLDPEHPVPLDHEADPATVWMKVGSEQTPTPGTPSPDGSLGIQGGTIFMPARGDDHPVVEFAAEYDYRVKPNGSLPGDFEIRSVQVSATELKFTDHDYDPEHPQEGFISVDRDLVLEGYVNNCGRLLAGRDVQLMPRDVTVDKLEQTTDLAVYAGRNVNIIPLFKGDEAERANAQRYFVFRGLVYAENQFQFLSSVFKPEGGGTVEFQRKLYIEGALVARRGNVFIHGNETVELKYNREFLDDLMEKSFDENQAQLEELSWRPLSR